jgi:hypothetical protein
LRHNPSDTSSLSSNIQNHPSSKRVQHNPISTLTTHESTHNNNFESSSNSNYKIEDRFKVVKGVFTPRKLETHVLIISEGWPSWTYALAGLGFKSLATLASFGSFSSRYKFFNTSLGSTIVTNTSASIWMNDHVKDGIIFIQGSKFFFASHYDQLDTVQVLFFVFYQVEVSKLQSFAKKSYKCFFFATSKYRSIEVLALSY